jgi:hypothetical protein
MGPMSLKLSDCITALAATVLTPGAVSDDRAAETV